jgi:hypothetical protein
LPSLLVSATQQLPGQSASDVQFW